MRRPIAVVASAATVIAVGIVGVGDTAHATPNDIPTISSTPYPASAPLAGEITPDQFGDVYVYTRDMVTNTPIVHEYVAGQPAPISIPLPGSSQVYLDSNGNAYRVGTSGSASVIYELARGASQATTVGIGDLSGSILAVTIAPDDTIAVLHGSSSSADGYELTLYSASQGAEFTTKNLNLPGVTDNSPPFYVAMGNDHTFYYRSNNAPAIYELLLGGSGATVLTNVGTVTSTTQIATTSDALIVFDGSSQPFRLDELKMGATSAVRAPFADAAPTLPPYGRFENFGTIGDSIYLTTHTQSWEAGENDTTMHSLYQGGIGLVFGLAVDGQGDVFAADYFGQVVEFVSGNRNDIRVLPFVLDPGFQPVDIAVDGAGDVFVDEDDGGGPGGHVFELPAGATAQIVLPVPSSPRAFGMSVDTTGDLFVNVYGQGVYELAAGASSATKLGFPDADLGGVASDNAGHIYAYSFDNPVWWEYDLATSSIIATHDLPSTDVFDPFDGMVATPDGAVYMGGYHYTGSGSSYSVDVARFAPGSDTPEYLNFPTAPYSNGLEVGVAVKPDGSVLLADQMTGDIRELSFSAPATRPAVAEPGSFSVPEYGASAAPAPIDNPDSVGATYTVTSGPSHGTLSGAAPSLRYTPAYGYTGPDAYSFSVRDAAGDTSSATVAVTVTPVTPAAPSFLVQPADVTANAGDSDSFSTFVLGGASNRLQWQMSSNGGTTWTPVPGATTAVLSVPSVSTSLDQNEYRLMVTNPGGAVFSNTATLTVLYPATPSHVRAIQWGLEASAAVSPWPLTPVPLELNYESVKAVAAGYDTHLALTTAGKVVAWGFEGGVQPCCGTYSFPDPGAAEVPASLDNQTVTAIAAGNEISMALTQSGQVVEWGDPSAYQSYLPTKAQLQPPPSLAGKTVTAISAGFEQCLAIADGQVVAWGGDQYGETNVPASLSGKTVTAIAAGGTISMALTSDGQVTVWGDNSSGELAIPASLTGKTVVAIAAGQETAMALTSDNHIVTWGQLSDANVNTPEPAALKGKTISSIAAGAALLMATTTDGELYTWGNDIPQGYGGTPQPDLTGHHIIGVATGYASAIVLDEGTGPLNTPPVASDSTRVVPQNGSVGLSLSACDADNDALSYSVTSGPAHGVLTGTAPDLTYTPTVGYSGPDSVSWSVDDGQGGSASATVSITVSASGGDSVSQPVTAGQTVSTGGSVTASEPTQAAVTTPVAGTVSIQTDSSVPDPAGYGVVGSQYVITAPAASAAAPLSLTFTLSAASLPAGESMGTVTVFRDGVAIAACTASDGSATPDPCVSSRTQAGDTITITVLSSHASQWTLGVATSSTTSTLSVPSTSVYGSSVSLSAHVSASGSALPSGSVLFTDSATSPVTVLGSAPINATGNAVLTMTTLPAGAHSITASYAATTNTAGSVSAAHTVTVARGPLAVTPNPQTIAYGQPDPAFTYTVTGLVNGDALLSAPTCSVAVAHTKVGTYPIGCHGASASPNYTLNQSGTAIFTVTLNVSTAGIPTGLIKKAYSGKLTTTGGTGTLHYSLAGGQLPPGLKLATTGRVTGTPTAQGVFVAQVHVSDSATPTAHAVTVPVTITIGPMSITTASLPGGLVGKAYSARLAVTGGTASYTFSIVSGTLPAGLTMSAAGAISGTPKTSGTSAFTVSVHDASKPTANVATRVETITIAAMSLTPTLPGGLVGKAYAGKVVATGGKPTVTYAITGGTLPPGLKLSTAGAVSGTPTASGSYTVTITAKDTTAPTANTARGTYTITIAPMTITTTSLPNGTAKKAYPTTTLTSSGGVGTKHYTLASGALPPGLKISTTGTISGTPTSSGTYTVTIRLTDSAKPANTTQATYTITVT